MKANKPSVYIETTVVSYYVSRPSRDLTIAARQALTRQWWDTKRRDYRVVASPAVFREARMGDADAAQRRIAALAIPKEGQDPEQSPPHRTLQFEGRH